MKLLCSLCSLLLAFSIETHLSIQVCLFSGTVSLQNHKKTSTNQVLSTKRKPPDFRASHLQPLQPGWGSRLDAGGARVRVKDSVVRPARGTLFGSLPELLDDYLVLGHENIKRSFTDYLGT